MEGNLWKWEGGQRCLPKQMKHEPTDLSHKVIPSYTWYSCYSSQPFSNIAKSCRLYILEFASQPPCSSSLSELELVYALLLHQYSTDRALPLPIWLCSCAGSKIWCGCLQVDQQLPRVQLEQSLAPDSSCRMDTKSEVCVYEDLNYISQ